MSTDDYNTDSDTVKDTPSESREKRAEIVVDDPRLRRNFVMLPHEVMEMTTLSNGAKMTYAWLLRFAWEDASCFPGMDTLTAKLAVNHSAVTAYLRELVAHRLVSIKRRGRGQTNLYRLLPLADAGLAPLAVAGTTKPPANPQSRKRESSVLRFKKAEKPQSRKRESSVLERGKPALSLRKTKTQREHIDSLTNVSGADALPSPPISHGQEPQLVQSAPLGPRSETTSAPYKLAVALLEAQHRPVTQTAVGRYLPTAKSEVVEAYHGKATLADATACIAYLLTDPWYAARPTRLTPAKLGEELGPWLAKGKPARFQELPRAAPAGVTVPITGRSQIVEVNVPAEETQRAFAALVKREP